MKGRLPGGDPGGRSLRPVPGVLVCRLLLRGWETGRPYGCAGVVVRGEDGVHVLEALLSPFDREMLRGDSWWIFIAWYPQQSGGGSWLEQRYQRPGERPAAPAED